MKQLRLPRAMRMLGVPASLADAADEAAVRRCLQCRAGVSCEEALRDRDARTLRLLCPNSHYIQQLRSRSLRFM